jgi:hypothetical protein
MEDSVTFSSQVRALRDWFVPVCVQRYSMIIMDLRLTCHHSDEIIEGFAYTSTFMVACVAVNAAKQVAGDSRDLQTMPRLVKIHIL